MSQPATNSNGSLAKRPIGQAGLGEFGKYLKANSGSIKRMAAKTIDPEQFAVQIFNSVSLTPALQKCSMVSVLRASLQAAQLGLTPGNALGEAYLVPYGDQAVMIPGYRGLGALAFRSGHVLSINAREVYEGDDFEFEFGLNPRLKLIPGSGDRDASRITHVFCVINLKDGAVLYDVMTRAEVERIRKRSKAGGSGPWMTDYAEMAKKTVMRRCLKLAPMSVEMSKALSADNAADTGDMSLLEFEGDDFIDGEDAPETAEQPRTTGVEAVKGQLGLEGDGK